MFFDPLYLLFMIPGLILMMIAQVSVRSAFNKYGRMQGRRRITGAAAATEVLRQNGVMDVSVTYTQGDLTDRYDPRNKTIYLSENVYNAASVAAVGIAAHEAGHAVQHAGGYAPLTIRNAIVPVCNIGSGLSVPLIIIGFILTLDFLVYLGIGLFALVLLFQLVTLPVEFNASRRALESIGTTGMLYEDEYAGAKKVLSAAAMTYVASMLQTTLLLLYYVFRFTGRRR